MNLSLTGRRAVVCGSTQGIGLAIAEELAALGASCTLMARNREALERAVQTLPTAFGQQHQAIVADFSDTEQVKKGIEEIVKNAAVHILINNTGGPPAGTITAAKTEDFVAAFQQHLVNNHTLATTVLEGMKQEGYGRIINIISTSIKIPLPNLGVSNTIRGAVASWAKTLSNEVAQFGITVNNILPGLTETSRLDSLIKTTAQNSNKSIEEVSKEMSESIPAKRFGKAAELAAVAAFLASPAASYVNGVSIAVDGGRTGTI